MTKKEAKTKPFTIEKAKLLIVEGKTDKDFFDALLNSLKRTDTQVIPMNGKDRLRALLEVIVRQPDLPVQSLIIARDADGNPKGAFDSVCSALSNKNVGLPAPKKPLEFVEGPTSFGKSIKVSVIVIPLFEQKGALEDLLLQMSADDPLLSLAIKYIENAIETLKKAAHRPPPRILSKAQIHAFLATFEEADRDPGIAALEGVWNFQHFAFEPILKIVQEM